MQAIGTERPVGLLLLVIIRADVHRQILVKTYITKEVTEDIRVG